MRINPVLREHEKRRALLDQLGDATLYVVIAGEGWHTSLPGQVFERDRFSTEELAGALAARMVRAYTPTPTDRYVTTGRGADGLPPIFQRKGAQLTRAAAEQAIEPTRGPLVALGVFEDLGDAVDALLISGVLLVADAIPKPGDVQAANRGTIRPIAYGGPR